MDTDKAETTKHQAQKTTLKEGKFSDKGMTAIAPK